MRLLSSLILPLVLVTSTSARAQGPADGDVVRAATELRAAAAALPPALRSDRLSAAADWLANAAGANKPADVSAEYTESLRRATALLREQPTRDIVEDITADLEAKVDHCRKMGVGMGGQVTLRVNTLRDTKPVGNWRVRVLLKFFERVKGVEPRAFLRVSTPTEMALEPGRYWVWAQDPATGRTSERVLATVTGQKELVLDLTLP